jgi:hypothetical protein
MSQRPSTLLQQMAPSGHAKADTDKPAISTAFFIILQPMDFFLPLVDIMTGDSQA